MALHSLFLKLQQLLELTTVDSFRKLRIMCIDSGNKAVLINCFKYY